MIDFANSARNVRRKRQRSESEKLKRSGTKFNQSLLLTRKCGIEHTKALNLFSHFGWQLNRTADLFRVQINRAGFYRHALTCCLNSNSGGFHAEYRNSKMIPYFEHTVICRNKTPPCWCRNKTLSERPILPSRENF